MLAILLLASSAGQDIFSQEKISGVVNQYGRIDSILNANNANQDSVIVPGAKDIWTGADEFEIALFIQVKGTGIYDPFNFPFQQFWGSEFAIFNTGIYSFMLVDRVVGDSLVIFSSSLREDMIEQADTVPATAQLIKVPYGKSFELEGDIQVDPWDPVTKTGGVIALFASDKLDLAGYNIDASAGGFRGGDTLRDDYGPLACASPAKDSTYYLDTDDHLAGRKGESTVYSGYPFTRGNGFTAGGGGGGEGRYSGGAGGSNWGKGSKGGKEAESFCSPSRNYGGWGYAMGADKMPGNENRVYFGSGGGSSVPEPGLTATPGGNGGGIVIIISDTLAGSSGDDAIIVAGESVTDTSYSGGGGGGAGGFILLDINTVTDNVLLDVSGGKGGDTYDPVELHGPGGGGGGGIIWHSGATLLPGLTENKSAGAPGRHLPDDETNGAGTGSAAKTETDLILPLRGFFFNFISSDEDVCQDTLPATIIGSQPKGDVAFLYEWQDSTMGFVPASVVGAVAKDYSPTVLTETTWYRRIVTTTTTVPIESDTSNWIEKTVFNRIQNNLIAPDDTVCFNIAPDLMIFAGGGLTGGNGTYDYQWLARADDSSSWENAGSYASDGIDTGEGFNPDKLHDTTYFSRQVISHVCQNISDSLTVVVLPLIDNNEITGEDTVCQFTDAQTIAGLLPTGGDIGNYNYIWQASSDKVIWNIISTGTINYSPGSMDTTTTHYRRQVYSGKDNTCSSISSPVTIQVDPEIRFNSIAPDTAICAETPTNLIYPDAVITGGNGPYFYTFYESTDSSGWTEARTESLIATHDPLELDQTTWFYRSVISGTCFDTSNAIRFYVDTVITNNNLLTANDTICQGTDSQGIPGSDALGGDKTSYSYQWDKSTDFVVWTDGFISGRDLAAQLLYETTWYRRRVLSGVCADTSSITIVNVHDTIAGNLIWADTVLAEDVCVLLPKLIRGQNENNGLSGGTGNPSDYMYSWEESDPPGTWNNAPAGGALSNNLANYETEVLTGSEYTYRRLVSSGKCSNISDSITLVVKLRPMGSITSTPIDSSCYNGTDDIRIVVPMTFTEGLKPFTLHYSDGAGGTGTEIMDSYNGDFNVLRGTSDSTLYSVVIDSIIDAYGCVDTMLLASKGQKQAMLYINQSPAIIQDTFSVCGPEATIAVTEGIGSKRYWRPASNEYTFTPVDLPQTVFTLTGWNNDTLFYPVTWFQKNGVCDENSATVIVELYQQPPVASVWPSDSLVYFRQFMPLWADTSEIGLGTWTWEDDPEWKTSDGGDPVKDIHNSSSEIDLGGENMETEVERHLTWWISNGECPTDSVNVEITRRDLVMYTAFSPNGDVFNEYLILDGLEWADEFVMQIFSRHMVLVKTIRESDIFVDPRTGLMNAVWDGRMEDGSEATDGTYFYMIEVTHAGQNYNYKNFLELIRTEVQ